MNRRNFLRRTVQAAVGGSMAMAGLDWFLEENPGYTPIIATIGEYKDYTSFSDLAIQQSIDEMVRAAAIQLGQRAGQDINSMYQKVFGM